MLSEVEQVSDRVAILRRGKLVHLSSTTGASQGRLIVARLTGPEVGPAPPGLTVRARHGDRVTMEYDGPLPPLLEWLARQPLADLRLEPLGLAAVYQRYHGPDA